MLGDSTKVRDNIIVVLKDAKTGRVKQVVKTEIDPLDPEQLRLLTHNIVTNAGDKYYAQRAAAETASLTFTLMTAAATLKAATKNAVFSDLVNKAGTNAPLAAFTATFDSGFPKTNDTDTDNTGADSDIVSWLRTYSTSQANTDVKAIVINQVNASTKVQSATTNNLLNASILAVSVTKTSSDTLKVFVNHTFTGV